MYHYDIYGWYTSTPLEGRTTNVAPISSAETTTPGAMRSNWTGYGWVDTPYVAPPTGVPQPTVVPVPVAVTMRQARLALRGAGLLSAVDVAIAALPSPQKEDAQIEWEYSQTVERHRGFVLLLGAALGLTELQIDALFVTAAGL